MDLLIRTLLGPWTFEPLVVFNLVVVGLLYVGGWQRLRRRGHRGLANGWRLAAYLGGLLTVALALLSPIDTLGGVLFMFHMVQHLLLMMVAAPLMLLANPFPVVLWALPRSARMALGRSLRPGTWLTQGLRAATNPLVAWMVYLAIFLGWHDPNLYNLALRFEWVHDLEHATFFLGALLFWWHVIGAGPYVHRRLSTLQRAIYALSMIPANMLTGVALAFAETPVYTYYTTVPRIYGIGVMEDQIWGGQIMWIPGSMMYLIAALILFSRLMGDESKPIRSMEEWDTDEALIAPGLEHRRDQRKWRALKADPR